MIDNIIHFAEEAYKESQEQIKRYDEFNLYVAPLFEKEFGVKYRPELRSMYRNSWKEWLNKKEKELFGI